MIRLGRVAISLGVALALLAAACTSSGSDTQPSGDAPSTAEVSAILEGLADDVIIPSYVSFAASMGELSAATNGLCTEPSEANLAQAQQSWQSAVLAWQRTRAGAVGPAMDRRLMSAVAFAVRPALVDDLLAGDDPVDAAGLARQGAAVRGLYAAEYALFGEGSKALTSPEGARRCQYVAGIAEVSGAAATEVAADWTTGGAREAFVAGDGNGPQSTVAALTNEVSRRLDEIDTRGLRDLSEADGLDDLDERRADGPGAFRLADRKALSEGVTAIIGDENSGIAALLAMQDPDTAARLVAASVAADQTMEALPDSVADAFDDPEAVTAASEAIAELKVLVSTEVAAKLGVTITFSDSDGDG